VKECPFCGSMMRPMSGPDAAKALLDVIMSPKFPMRQSLEGAANRSVGNRVQLCTNGECCFLAIFVIPIP